MGEVEHTLEADYDASDEYRPEPPPEPVPPPWKDGSLRIGIHTSIAGDIAGALDTAYRLGANAVQIFTFSPRMWALTPQRARISPANAARFRERRAALRIGPVVVHANYLINPASPQPVLRAKSVQAFHDEIARALALGADYLVLHPGSGRGRDHRTALQAVADALRQATRGLRLDSFQVLLENAAGQGNDIGAKFADLRFILDQCADLLLGVCVDTAHLFAAGHDLRTAEGLDGALQEIERTVGIDRVAVVHANDSKASLGSRLDRHQHIGKGYIGLEGFRRILSHSLLAGKPFILETPIDRPGDDARNVRTLWKLAGREIPLQRAKDGFPARRAGKQRKLRTAARKTKNRRK